MWPTDKNIDDIIIIIIRVACNVFPIHSCHLCLQSEISIIFPAVLILWQKSGC